MLKYFSIAYWGERKRSRAREDFSVKRELKAIEMEHSLILKEARNQLKKQTPNKKEIRLKHMKK